MPIVIVAVDNSPIHEPWTRVYAVWEDSMKEAESWCYAENNKQKKLVTEYYPVKVKKLKSKNT